VSGRGFGWLLAGLTPVYLVLAAVLPPADDELYYWCWSERLQLSYYDHPPMTAYLIRAATSVFGDTLFAIRLPAVLSTLTVLGVVGYLTRPRSLLPLVVFTPLFTLGAVLVTPDTPLLMFWALYLLWLVKVHEALDATPGQPGAGGWGPAPGKPGAMLWALGGVVLGCGILGKYTTGLAVMGGFLTFAVAVPWRRWLVGYAGHLAVAFVVTLPILLHNIRHDFAPLLYQWKHSMSSPEPGVVPFLGFVGVQLLLFGTIPFIVFGWAVLNRRELLADPRLRACAGLFVFPFAFFLYKATRGPLEGNWALACYIAVWPLAAVWYGRLPDGGFWKRAAPLGFAAPAVAVLFLAAHLVHPLPVLSPQADRVTRQVSKMAVARELAETLRARGGNEPVFVASYQWTALLRFHGVDAHQIDGVTRPSHFTQTPECLAGRDHALVFADEMIPEEHVRGFDPPRRLVVFPLTVRGELVGGYWLLEYCRSGGLGGPDPGATAAVRLDPPGGGLPR
jgi:4-amino-4-deoxy-L-arabinose transferase-like glycosyltransferase